MLIVWPGMPFRTLPFPYIFQRWEIYGDEAGWFGGWWSRDKAEAYLAEMLHTYNTEVLADVLRRFLSPEVGGNTYWFLGDKHLTIDAQVDLSEEERTVIIAAAGGKTESG